MTALNTLNATPSNPHLLESLGIDNFRMGCTFNENGRLLTAHDSKGYRCVYTRDANDKILSFCNSKGHWYEYTRDSEGRPLTMLDSHGYWQIWDRNAQGEELLYRSSNGTWKPLATHDKYTLRVNMATGEFWAGCRSFGSLPEALDHWRRPDLRALMFSNALMLYGNKLQAQA